MDTFIYLFYGLMFVVEGCTMLVLFLLFLAICFMSLAVLFSMLA